MSKQLKYHEEIEKLKYVYNVSRFKEIDPLAMTYLVEVINSLEMKERTKLIDDKMGIIL